MKFFSLLTATVISVAVLSGCGGDSEQEKLAKRLNDEAAVAQKRKEEQYKSLKAPTQSYDPFKDEASAKKK